MLEEVAVAGLGALRERERFFELEEGFSRGLVIRHGFMAAAGREPGQPRRARWSGQLFPEKPRRQSFDSGMSWSEVWAKAILTAGCWMLPGDLGI